jgi:hypothetical protein
MTTRRLLLPLLATIVALSGCGADGPKAPAPSKEPISVRGWILDVDGAKSTGIPEAEAARKTQLFQNTYVEVQGAPYVSGGINEDGSFILLDVPPGNVTITFTAPGATKANLLLANVPGNADVVIPALVLANGGVKLSQPTAVVVRVGGGAFQKLAATASIAGHPVQVVQVPLANMADRREYPAPPKGMAGKMATVK